MAKEYRAGSAVRSEDNFTDKFRREFGREMTPEERRFFKLANVLLEDESEAALHNPENDENVA
jgi:hypothetical protein